MTLGRVGSTATWPMSPLSRLVQPLRPAASEPRSNPWLCVPPRNVLPSGVTTPELNIATPKSLLSDFHSTEVLRGSQGAGEPGAVAARASSGRQAPRSLATYIVLFVEPL